MLRSGPQTGRRWRSLRRRCVAAVVAVAAMGCTTTAAPAPAAMPAFEAPFRAVGAARLAGPRYRARFDVALLADPASGRIRLDVALPTGTSAAVLWFAPPTRWILLDPAGAEAWTGSLRDVFDILQVLPASYQAPIVLAFGVEFLNPDKRFGKILPLAGSVDTPEIDVVSTGYGGRVTTPSATWNVAVRQPDNVTTAVDGVWSPRWRVDDGTTTLEVSWQSFDVLTTANRRLLEPRVPASFSVRSWRAWLRQQAAPAPDPTNEPRRPPPKKAPTPPSP